ncbi:hypothetical protein VTN31DRAFT_2098 [Thermomyces dupontii]|uniref:uncharacterized protein n=1 Tax=Talaromyces thermophilus TaxID=28565 RepID=UPI003742C939
MPTSSLFQLPPGLADMRERLFNLKNLWCSRVVKSTANIGSLSTISGRENGLPGKLATSRYIITSASIIRRSDGTLLHQRIEYGTNPHGLWLGAECASEKISTPMER